MSSSRIVALVLIIAGIIGLAYGGFSYRQETHHGSVGPFEFSLMETKTVNVQVWAGLIAIVVGGALLFTGAAKR